jgi:hypothetical protein
MYCLSQFQKKKLYLANSLSLSAASLLSLFFYTTIRDQEAQATQPE